MEIYATEGLTAAGRAAGVNVSTIRRWAKERGVACFQPPLVHGTRTGWNRGCRCVACAEGNRATVLADKAKLRAKVEQAPHGTPSAYINWQCRCEPCKKAGSIQNAETRRRRLARQAAAG